MRNSRTRPLAEGDLEVDLGARLVRRSGKENRKNAHIVSLALDLGTVVVGDVEGLGAVGGAA